MMSNRLIIELKVSPYSVRQLVDSTTVLLNMPLIFVISVLARSGWDKQVS